MILSSNIYAIETIKAFRYYIFNSSKKYIFNISCKIYFNTAQYQYYQATELNDARFYNYGL